MARLRDGITATDPALIAATWFGCGLLPKAPGTWGSLAALPFAWVLRVEWGFWGLAIATLLVSLVGWWAAEVYARKTGIADPGEVVIDEVAGQWLTLLPVPADPIYYLGGFLLFRLFDIKKPWVIGWADRNVHGGLGIMLDDLFAGAFGAVVLIVALWGVPTP